MRLYVDNKDVDELVNILKRDKDNPVAVKLLERIRDYKQAKAQSNTLNRKKGSKFVFTNEEPKRSVEDNQRWVIEKLGLRETFRNSKYSSYGWFLRSLGIHVTDKAIYVEPSSKYFAEIDRL